MISFILKVQNEEINDQYESELVLDKDNHIKNNEQKREWENN